MGEYRLIQQNACTIQSLSLSLVHGLGEGRAYRESGFSIDLNFEDVMTSKLKNLDVSVQDLEVMQ